MAQQKGSPAWVFQNQPVPAVSEQALDCSDYNAVHVDVIVTGDAPSAKLSLLGAASAGGTYTALPDASASQTVTTTRGFDAVAGAAYVKAQLSDITGSFGAGQGFTVILTPFNSPGPISVVAQVGS